MSRGCLQEASKGRLEGNLKKVCFIGRFSLPYNTNTNRYDRSSNGGIVIVIAARGHRPTLYKQLVRFHTNLSFSVHLCIG